MANGEAGRRDAVGAIAASAIARDASRRSTTLVVIGLAAAAVVYDPLATAIAPKRVALLALGVVGLALTAPRLLRGDAPPLPRSLTAWLMLVAWLGATLAWAPHGQLGHLPTWLGLGALGLALSARTDQREIARGVATLVGAACGATALAQYAGGARGLAVHGLCGNPNWLGLVLACCLPLELELAFAIGRQRRAAPAGATRHGGGRRWELALVCFALASTLAGLVLGHSRTAWVGLFVAALACPRGRMRLLALGPATVLGMAALGHEGMQAALAGRAWIWRVGANAALAAQPFGAGMGEFPWAFLGSQSRALAPLSIESASSHFTNATSAHDDWLEIACDGGAVALVLVVAAFVSGVASTRRAWRGGAACLVVAAVSAFADTPLTQPGLLVVLAPILAAGAPGSPPPKALSSRGLRRVLAAMTGIATLAAAAMGLRFATAGYLAERLLSTARDAAPGERTELLARARRLAPASAEAMLESGLDALDAGEPQRALPWLEAASRRMADVGALVAVGNARLMLGDLQAARAAYEHALVLQPASFRAHVNLAEALRLAGELSAAERHLADASELQPFHPKVVALTELLRRARNDAETREALPP